MDTLPTEPKLLGGLYRDAESLSNRHQLRRHDVTLAQLALSDRQEIRHARPQATLLVLDEGCGVAFLTWPPASG